MARMNIPLEALTSRLNLHGRFDSVRSQSIANRFANLKPVGEFLDIKRIGRPANIGELQTRVNYNLSYFSSNYAVLFVMLSIYSLLTNLLLFFVILLVVGGMFGIGKLQGADLDMGFARFTSSQLYTGLLIVSVPLGLWASPIATVLWLVGATAVSILGHASLMDRPIEASFSEYDASKPPTSTVALANTTSATERRFKDRSAAQSSSPYEGRPPGALSDDSRRGRYLEDWELRQQHATRYGERFEEISEDEDGQGVSLDPHGYAIRDGRQRGFAGDELYFDGYDIGRDRQRRRQVYDYGDNFDSEGEYYNRRMGATDSAATAARDRDEELMQTALARIAAARTRGKSNVNLSPEEMEALERRHRSQPPERTPPPVLLSPPATPAKTPKGKVGSRTSSSTSLAAQRKKKGSSSISSPAKSNSKAKVERKPSAEQQTSPYTPGAGPPGIMVPGPNGVPVFAPLVNYPPLSSPELTRAGAARPRSRSTSKHSRRDSTPPERVDPYTQYPSPYYMPPPPPHPQQRALRPEYPGPPHRPTPQHQDEMDYYPPSPRHRSASTVAAAQYASLHRRTSDDYDFPPPLPPLPAAQSGGGGGGGGGRRHVSGPPDVRYASLRRVPPASSPLAPSQRPGPGVHSASDPAVFGSGGGGGGWKGSGLGRGVVQRGGSSGSSSGSGEDQGVQIGVEGVVDGGREAERGVGGGGRDEGRRRKSGRR
ncbi:Prenylated Rab acceptor 1 [Friedmanniomyces endolithicus]|uniref:Prenylated Rab acceptor 1 n=1 Tax=Friedmanniomyces endolithicus TaxID=329885 RepID=A0AAN6HAV4_9PEZI|nr:Prenylated Rab acceptor 1 [Friedmanniomyces endolithicus]KAK0280952.1 Prenylated Rab acceptor 1 [Friedmanniomyces endolithicus]KAK0312517.1 Prenylated Rab acceptor 1 [Friedmanniomyces endolithicus]KAK0962466.1 Prenylated Rab acceptor 1 [Friedmanniomyces endolithicus]KAK1006738.1 Prenylated Rab acceptor 1 [Friedmanniomyces endolithicus]